MCTGGAHSFRFKTFREILTRGSPSSTLPVAGSTRLLCTARGRALGRLTAQLRPLTS